MVIVVILPNRMVLIIVILPHRVVVVIVVKLSDWFAVVIAVKLPDRVVEVSGEITRLSGCSNGSEIA